MITTIYLIRHGKTVGGEEKRYKGHLDVPLSEEGIEQVRGLAGYLRKINDSDATGARLSAVYCSDLVRALKSAEIIASPFGVSPVRVLQLRERNFGRWEGMSFAEIREQFPAEFDAWANDPVRYSPLEGESTEEVRARVMPVFSALVTKHAGEAIAVVSHGGVTRVILCEVLGIPLRNIFRIEQNFGCLNRVEYYDDMPVVKALNCTVEGIHSLDNIQPVRSE